MNRGIDLTAFAAKLEANKLLKRDYIVETPAMAMIIDGDRKPQLTFKEPTAPIAFTFPILETAHNQIGDRLKIPAKYYDRMRAEAPDLLAVNVNRWLHQTPEKRMIRTLGGDARAFLSNSYHRIENEEIASAALPILAAIPDVQFLSFEVTERRMYIQAVSPRVEGEVKQGDVVQAGVVISNSEIGQGAVSVSPMIYRLVCLNGAIREDGRFRAYHVGKHVDSNEELWADDTRKADDVAVLKKVRDMVGAAVDQVRFSQAIEKMQGLAQARVTGDPAKAVEVLAAKVGASDGEQGGILRALIDGGDLSAWGLVNAVTVQAHGASYDRSIEFEAAGGSLIDLAPGEWKRILEAA